MHRQTRRIGPIGTTTRLLAAAGLIYLALFDGADWGLEWYDVAVGLGVLPAAAMVFGLAARRYANGPVRFTGSAGTTANCLVIIALAVNPYTAGGAALFYGATLLLAAWRAQPGCEATVVSNSILGRDDQLGCPIFSPIDQAEARLGARSRSRRSGAAASSIDRAWLRNGEDSALRAARCRRRGDPSRRAPRWRDETSSPWRHRAGNAATAPSRTACRP
jgi:hypothetical protein